MANATNSAIGAAFHGAHFAIATPIAFDFVL